MQPSWLVQLFVLAVIAPWAVAQTTPPSEDDITFVQRVPQTKADADSTVEFLQTHPDDRVAHIRLFSYYWWQSNGTNRAEARHSLLEQADWFAVHEPQSVVFDRTGFNLRPTDFSQANSMDLSRYKQHWAAAVQRSTTNKAVIQHALNALQAVDVDVPIFCDEVLRDLAPTEPQYAMQEASLYLRVIDFQFRNNGGTSTAMSDLMKSTDSAVIGLTGQALYNAASLPAGKNEAEAALGLSLLKRAQELNPANTRWIDAQRLPPPASMAQVAAVIGDLREEDLWVGGKVPGIPIPAGAVTVDPAVQAAKLDIPNPVFLKNLLSAQQPGPGEVKLLAVVGPDGHVQQVQFESGSAKHFPYAMYLVKSYIYKPTLVKGVPVSVATKIDVKYTAPFVIPGNPGVTEFARLLGGVAGSSMGVVPVLKTASPDAVKLAPDDLRALILSEPAIAYPPTAKGAGIVLLRVVISKTGTVQEDAVFAGHPDFRQAALEGIKSWKYKPYLVNGEPREVESDVSVLFTADGAKGIGTLIGSGLGPQTVVGMSGMALPPPATPVPK